MCLPFWDPQYFTLYPKKTQRHIIKQKAMWQITPVLRHGNKKKAVPSPRGLDQGEGIYVMLVVPGQKGVEGAFGRQGFR